MVPVRRFFNHIFYLALAVLLDPTELAAFSESSLDLSTRRIAGAYAHVITVNLNDPGLTIDICTADGGVGRCESFAAMVRRRAPLAAVTGTYFDTRTFLPVGTIITGGRAVYRGAVGTAVCFLRTDATKPAMQGAGPAQARNTVEFVDCKIGDRTAWAGVNCGLRTGPRLLEDGRCVLDPAREGFRSQGLFGKRTRMALGLTRHNKLLLVAVRTPVTFGKLAGIMKSLGASDAVCLDGGTSSAMYYRGKIVCSPGRVLTNLIEVRECSVVAAPGPTAVENPNDMPIAAASAQAKNIAGDATIARSNNEPGDLVRELALYGNFPAPAPRLRLAKGGGAVGPVNGAKLTGLKRLENSKNFVHVASNVKVVHHRIP